MGNDFGTLTKESLTTYSWDISNDKLLNGIFYASNSFSVLRYDCTFRFQIQKVSENKYKLFLKILPKGDWKLDLYIILEYKTEKKDFSLKSIINREYDPLATIQVKDLMKITCTFLKVERFITPSIDTNIQVTTVVPPTVSTSDRKSGKGSSDIQEPLKLRNIQVTTIVPPTVSTNDRKGGKGSSDIQEPLKLRNIQETAIVPATVFTSERKDEEVSSYIPEPQKPRNIQVTKIVPATVFTSGRMNEEGSSYIQEPQKPRSSDELGENFKNAFLDEEESDVTFKVGNKEYPAHKIIIKVRSPVFNAMLKHDMKEKKEGVINIPDCDPLIFRDFLFYIYTGKLDRVLEENVCELYRLSDKYDVKGLKKECLYFMHNSLSVNVICDVISLAATHYEHNLLSRATQFFIDHAQDILESVKWQTFVEEHPTVANELFLKTFKKISRK